VGSGPTAFCWVMGGGTFSSSIAEGPFLVTTAADLGLIGTEENRARRESLASWEPKKGTPKVDLHQKGPDHMNKKFMAPLTTRLVVMLMGINLL